jgi:hypothetical protein
MGMGMGILRLACGLFPSPSLFFISDACFFPCCIATFFPFPLFFFALYWGKTMKAIVASDN